ncbi:hypothetical protein [Puia dinghuensis]|uniref:Uncharacterized protein n=1 Tax=Puia dinghuensis TaxID=1792502 RepID=A0A8J2UCK6_9BACT|nr:hypothetical protein [Puia dinghuensis]GGA99125.1 hypothetical protein GCM10011511_23070 [Puia dinghuensis]
MMEKVTTPDTMTTSSQVLGKLRVNHMDNEFRWTPKGFTTTNDKIYRPEDLVIIRTLRFEGLSDSSDMEILYIIKANDGLIGYSLDAYGAYSSHDNEYGYNNFIRQIAEVEHDEQLLFTL